jgi:hypothetical protein
MLALARSLSKQIAIKWALTNEIVANRFTKELTPIKHSKFLKQLNIVNIKHMLKDIVKGVY